MWRGIPTTFGMIFIAEMLDKTQFMVLALGAKAESDTERLGVFLGASTALMCACALGVFFSGFIARLEHHQRTFEMAAVVGIAMFVSAWRGGAA